MADLWTVEARNPNAAEAAARGWTAWTEWVDRATAEAELVAARGEGYHARIVRARSVGTIGQAAAALWDDGGRF